MKKREKRMVIATIGVVAMGLASWVARGDRAPAASASNEKTAGQTPGAAAPGSESGATRVGPAPAANPAPAAGSAAPPAGYRWRPGALERVLAFSAALPALRTECDPFGFAGSEVLEKPVHDSTRPRTDKKLAKAIHFGGTYVSGGKRGALLDGKVIFEGERLDKQTRLVSVLEAEARVEIGGKEYSLYFEPHLATQDTEVAPATGGNR